MRFHPLLLLCCTALLGAAHAAPLELGREQASGPARRDGGTGVCMTAVHLNQDGLLRSTTDAIIRLEQPVLDPVDGKVRRLLKVVNLRNAHAEAGGDYGGDEELLPFSNDARAMPRRDDKNVAVRVRGYLNVTRPGVVTVGAYADDGFRLLLGGLVVLRSQSSMPGRYTQQVRFQAAGLYAVELVYFQSDGPALLELSLAEGAEAEVRGAPARLPDTFRPVETLRLYSSIAGQGGCGECNGDGECGPGAFCGDVKLCQPCLTAQRCGDNCLPCPQDRPACDSGACVECTAVDDGRCRARGQVCHTATGTCGPCVEDSECLEGERCNRAAGRCEGGSPTGPTAECSATSDLACTRKRWVCDVVRGACSPCSRALPCQAGLVCDVDGLCVEPPRLGFAGGCNVAPRGGPWALGLACAALLAALLRRRGRRPGALLLLVGSLLAPGEAAAQTSLNAQTFRPAVGPENLITLEGTRTSGTLRPMASAVLEFAYRPLRMIDLDDGQTVANTVGSMTTMHLLLGLGLLRSVSVGAALPVVLHQEFDGRTPLQDVVTPPDQFGVGDLRLLAKVRLLGGEREGFGLALVPQVSFPTGKGGEFRGDDAFGIEPRAAVDYRLQRGVLLVANLGFLARTSEQMARNVRVTHQVRYGVGGHVPLLYGIGVSAELAGAIAVARSDEGALYAPLEALLSARWVHRAGLNVTLGGGAGLTSAVGAGQFRLFASIGYLPIGKAAPARPPASAPPARPEPEDPDPDKDNLIGVLDRCPREAGPLDNRGCPDRDSDRDGLIDRLDQCPQRKGPRYNQGCPEADSDGDGLPDRLDRCPRERGPIILDGCNEDGPPAPATVPAGSAAGERTAGKGDAPGLVDVQAERIVLRRRITFVPQTAQLSGDAKPVLAALAEVLKRDGSRRARLLVAPGSPQRAARKLAVARAEALLAALLEAGAPRRLLEVRHLRTPGEEGIGEVPLVRLRTQRPR